MASIDVAKLLAPVSPEKPEGEDLEYAPEFLELDRISHGKPEEQVGTVIKPAEEPEWKQVHTQALALAARTRDCRVGVLLLLGALKMEGLPGFAAGIAVLRGYLEKFWDTCYPKLDAEDNNDPTMRLMSLAPLSPPGDGEGDPVKLKQRLREVPLTNSRQVGRFGLKDILVASGQLPAPPLVKGAEAPPAPPTAAVIEAAFADTALEELQATATGIKQAIADIEAIDQLMVKKVGGGRGPNVRELKDLLQVIAKHMDAALGRRGVSSGAPAAAEAGAPAASGNGAAPAPVRMTGEILSRDDAMKAMDKICEYFEKHEPSSPVPLLIRRARRLAPLTFVDMIKDLSPEAVKQIEMIGGIAPKKA